MERTTAIKIVGNAKDNSILGGEGKNTLSGVAGNDILYGGKTNDSLNGGAGNDWLYGDAGADKLLGKDGDDSLWGGTGNDTLTGGAGADVFIYNAGDGKDTITDFANEDFLQIAADTFSASLNAKGNVVFKVDSTASAITLKQPTATTFNVNGDDYVISNNKLVKK